MLLRREPLFCQQTAIRVAAIMRRAGLKNATPLGFANGYVIEAHYRDSTGRRCYVAPGSYRGVRRVIARFKHEPEEPNTGGVTVNAPAMSEEARALVRRATETFGRYEREGKPYQLAGAVSDILTILSLLTQSEEPTA